MMMMLMVMMTMMMMMEGEIANYIHNDIHTSMKEISIQ